MTRARIGLIAAAMVAQPALAQDEASDGRGAVGTDIFYSTDADKTDVVRLAFDLDWLNEGPERYRGVRLEKAWFNPSGQGWRNHERVYLRAADGGEDWKWNARVGTDGDTLLGAASIRKADYAQEYFIEREIVETPQGLARGIYYTFAGASFDLAVDERNVFTVMGGLQEFTGDNLRKHVRANYVHVVKPELGLSAQLRTRYFHNSVPREYDYYSPRWYAQVLPVLQMRRFTDSGWRYLVAGGLGAQKGAGGNWRRSSYFNAQLTSPPRRKWSLDGAFLFSETPTGTGDGYRYVQFNFGIRRAF